MAMGDPEQGLKKDSEASSASFSMGKGGEPFIVAGSAAKAYLRYALEICACGPHSQHFFVF